MTETTQLNSRKPTFMSIGPLSLYCEHFKAAAARRFTEESTVQGEGVITNESGRAMEMTFSGRIYAGRQAAQQSAYYVQSPARHYEHDRQLLRSCFQRLSHESLFAGGQRT